MASEQPSGWWVRPLRLWSGLLLFTYLVTHFSNHALGLISLPAMEAGRLWFLALWRNPVGETALFGALLAHWLLGLWLLTGSASIRGAMVARVQEFSRSFGDELEAPLRLGVGIHTGPAVVGEMGYGETRYLTAVGDTVHVASRLEALTKEYQCELVVSEQVMARAGLDAADCPRHDLTMRNREVPLRIVVVNDARRLAERLPAGEGIGSRPT